MPLYQYECDDHGPFEAFAPMSDAGKTRRCPCGKAGLRVFVAPHVESDCTVYTEDRTDLNQFRSEAMRDFYGEKARKAGVNTAGKKYDYSLARYPGDPKAWVGSDGDVRQVLEHRGWGAKGKVNVKMRNEERVEAPKPGISEKAVREMVHERMVVDPGQKLSKVIEDVVNDHAPRGGKRIVKSPKRKAKR